LSRLTAFHTVLTLTPMRSAMDRKFSPKTNVQRNSATAMNSRITRRSVVPVRPCQSDRSTARRMRSRRWRKKVLYTACLPWLIGWASDFFWDIAANFRFRETVQNSGSCVTPGLRTTVTGESQRAKARRTCSS
jgi:hypothetical protein